MKKRDKIIYWISTVWLALGMVSTGIVQLIHQSDEVKNIHELGYPEYILTLLGVWKLLGAIAVLVPKFPVLKEWTYAGLVFAMTGAIFSRFTMSQEFGHILPALLLLTLSLVSYFFRPADRRINGSNA